MQSRKRQKPGLLRFPIYLTLLLVQFILINIGSLPLLIVKKIFFLAFSNYTLYAIRYLSIGKASFAYTLKRRGRPRKYSLSKTYRFILRSYRQIPRILRTTGTVVAVGLIIFTYTFLTFQAAEALPNPDYL